MIGACWLFTHLKLHEVPTSELPGRRSGWCWYVPAAVLLRANAPELFAHAPSRAVKQVRRHLTRRLRCLARTPMALVFC
jgi:hypothetical protein